MRLWSMWMGLFVVFLGCTSTEVPLGKSSSSEKGRSSEASGGAAGRTYRIAVIPKGTTHEFWKSVHAGAVNAARELGNVEILWKGSALESDTAGQIQVVQDFIVQRVDGICLAPLDSSALVEYVEEAAEKGIPVVIFDSGLDKEEHIVSYVATDNRKGGELAARELAQALGNSGDVVVLRYKQGSESTYQREEGFLECLRQDYPNIRILSSEEYAGTTPIESLNRAMDVLQKFKGEIDGIFAVCEPNATGVLGALNELELAGKVKFIAFDPNLPLIKGLEEGKVHGIVLQDPVHMGYTAVMTMMKHLKGEPVEKRIGTGEYVATPANMHDEQMQKLLKPEQFGE
jgi:ribose transport system substrate-binding protein